MLDEIFKALLITSLAGTCLTAVITALKPITKKVFGYSWHYYIWLAVFAVMILPVRFTLPQKADTSPVTVPTVQTSQTVQTAEGIQNADNVIPAVQTETKTDILHTGASFAKRIIDNRLNILAYLWLTGAIMMFLINLIGYIRLIINMRKNSVIVPCPPIADFTRRKVSVRKWENTSSPFMVGIFNPNLILPAMELTEEQLMNILRHEMTHFKRHDILYKWFAVLVKCLHWFNPVIWYAERQITTECEISCDMAVTLTMSKGEEMSYIDTVLSLLPTGKTKQIPLTTQMASSKRVLKRRFEMIRNKRRTNKFVSALSAVIAVVMLGTTVFASGVLFDLATDDYTIEITNNGEKIELTNKPFIDSGEVYVPLRDLFEKVGVMEHPDSKIEWNNGKIDLSIAFYDEAAVAEHQSLNNGNGVDVVEVLFKYQIEIGKKHLIYEPNSELPNARATRETEFAPILKNNITYIPCSYISRMLDTQKWNMNYSVYDKSGKLLVNSNGELSVGTIIVNDNDEVVFKSDDLKTPEKTISGFFKAFSNGDFTLMKNYCTENCVNSFFEKTLDGYQVFGMKNASSIRSMAYANGSSETSDKVFLEISLYQVEFEKTSVYAQNRSPVSSFYVILQRQNDESYLIDEFATGL